MSGSGSAWFEQLEAKLEQQLEAFLRANPAQETLLQEQEQQDRRRQQRRRRLALQGEAEGLRAELLNLAASIQQWQGRVERAQAAGATELAARAEAHTRELMERGRQRWQRLEALGQEFRAVEEAELEDAPQAQAGGTPRRASGTPRNAGSATANATGSTASQTAGSAATNRAGSGGIPASGAAGSAVPSNPAAADPPAVDLDQAWSRFEADQELEELRRRQRG